MMSSNQVTSGNECGVSDSKSLLNSPSLDVSDQSAFVELLLMDFSAVLNKVNTPLHDNKEYMQLTELKFLLKNVRELTAIQLFQSFSRSDTITYAPSTANSNENDNASFESADYTDCVNGVDGRGESKSKNGCGSVGVRGNIPELAGLTRRSTDRLILFQRRAKLDAILLELKEYIDNRLALIPLNTAAKLASVDTKGEGKTKEGEKEGEKVTAAPPTTIMESEPTRGLPRIVELCNRYNFSHSEREIFHLMVVVQGSSNSHVLVS